MYGRILTDDLRRLIYNASIYATRTGSLRGDSLWIQGASGIRVVTTDDWVILSDRAPTDGHRGAIYQVVTLDEMKGFNETLKLEMDPYIDLATFPGEHLDAVEAAALDLYTADQMVFEPDNGAKPHPIEELALHPDRLRKLSLVKPGKYPIDMKGFVDAHGDVVVAFRAGPTARGLIAPLDRETQLDKYTGEEVWR